MLHFLLCCGFIKGKDLNAKWNPCWLACSYLPLFCSQVTPWACLPISLYPGTGRTLLVLCQQFWCPAMEREMIEYIGDWLPLSLAEPTGTQLHLLPVSISFYLCSRWESNDVSLLVLLQTCESKSTPGFCFSAACHHKIQHSLVIICVLDHSRPKHPSSSSRNG